MADMPKGFTCECGQYHEFGMYVAAHWNDALIRTCNKCGRAHIVQRGTVALIPERKRRKKNG